MKLKLVGLMICTIVLAGCLNEFPGKAFGEEIGVSGNTYELLMDVEASNLTVDFFIIDQTNLTHGINIYTMTENNYQNFIECGAYATIDELSWDDAVDGTNTYEITATEMGDSERVYVVADNGHCIDDDRDDILLSWTVSWPASDI